MWYTVNNGEEEVNMKVCVNCQRVIFDKEEQCLGCGGMDFQLLLIPFYDDWEPYLEEKEE